jgi:hypothetical protein
VVEVLVKKQVEGGWDCTVVAADKVAVVAVLVVVADIAVVLALAVEV